MRLTTKFLKKAILVTNETEFVSVKPLPWDRIEQYLMLETRIMDLPNLVLHGCQEKIQGSKL